MATHRRDCSIAVASAQTGELAIAVATDPLTLDPRGASSVISWSLAYHIADPLVGKDKDLKIVPGFPSPYPLPFGERVPIRRGEDCGQARASEGVFCCTHSSARLTSKPSASASVAKRLSESTGRST
jgi:hypothetical protein